MMLQTQLMNSCFAESEQTNEKEIGSLPEKEFRVMIVKMIQTLEIAWTK